MARPAVILLLLVARHLLKHCVENLAHKVNDGKHWCNRCRLYVDDDSGSNKLSVDRGAISQVGQTHTQLAVFRKTLNCRIFLPFQSPAGKYGGLQYLPNGTWPATFVCLRHGTAGLRWAAEVHPVPPSWDPGGKAPTFWEIEARCAHENCGKPHTICRTPSMERISPMLTC